MMIQGKRTAIILLMDEREEKERAARAEARRSWPIRKFRLGEEPEEELSEATIRSLALFDQGELSLSQAAKMAGISIHAFLDLLGKAGIVVVDYPSEELEEDLKHTIENRRA